MNVCERELNTRDLHDIFCISTRKSVSVLGKRMPSYRKKWFVSILNNCGTDSVI